MTFAHQFDLTGKVALVTGARRGIGKGMALALAEAGADIIGVSAQMEEDADVGGEVRALGRNFTGYACDFSDRAALYDLVAKVQAAHPVVDILVNNGGNIRRKPAAEHPDAFWDEIIEINLTAQFILSREIGKGMLKRGSGKIIFTASVLSFQGGINVPGYAASKGGLVQLTKALANEWAGRGVNVNAIAPGYIETDNTGPIREDAARTAAILARIPAGRWGETADFGGPVVFLASDASRYVHGSVLVVDGGWLGR